MGFTFDMAAADWFADDPDRELGIDKVSIINGFARSESLWQANGRVRACMPGTQKARPLSPVQNSDITPP